MCVRNISIIWTNITFLILQIQKLWSKSFIAQTQTEAAIVKSKIPNPLKEAAVFEV